MPHVRACTAILARTKAVDFMEGGADFAYLGHWLKDGVAGIVSLPL